MAAIVEGLHSVTLHIRDPAQSRGFYRDVLGLKELMYDEKAQRIVFALPETRTLLTMHVMRPEEGGREPGTVSGLVFRSSDPVAACREVVRRGGTVVLGPTPFDSPVGTFLRAVIADPDGNEFLLSNRTD